MADHDPFRATLIRAVRELEVLRSRLNTSADPIAMIGIGLRLPGGVVDLAGLWKLLSEGSEAIVPVPVDRWPMDGFYAPEALAGRSYVREAGFLADVAGFDAEFFGINPLEAQSMDPQHRLLLETSWEALETAGIVPESLLGTKTGVFIGTTSHDYEHRVDTDDTNSYSMIGIHTPFTAGRISYHLGLRGPTLAVDTACSSSLVALKLACESLRTRQCDLALAGGVQLMIDPSVFVMLCRTRALAADGRSKTFSEHADGYGRGEGVVVIACERLADAVARGRNILAIVRGSAFNHDGASNGITAPSGDAQEQVIRSALADAGLGPLDVDFVECHGTGTRLGDPIEVQSLAAVYGAARDRPLLIGAIKPNIGHLESAAGVAGIAKILAAFRFGSLPPSIHSHPRNPFIDWEHLNVEVVDAARPWPHDSDRPPRAAVSSFGISGTNAHVILEAPSPPPSPATASQGRSEPTLIVLSGKSDDALRAQAARLRARVEAEDLDLLDLAFSLATTRTHHPYRAAIVADHRDELVSSLDAIVSSTPHPAHVDGRSGAPTRVVFVFPGQGAQWVDMAKALLSESDVFAAAIAACEVALRPHVSWSLLDVLHAAPDAPSLDRVDVVQPVLFAMMVSLAALWRSLGVVPDVVVGHSQGEIAAAHVAGVLSLDDAAKIVALRSQVIGSELPAGAMAAVSLSADQLTPMISRFGDRLAVAVDNGPSSTAISGDPDAIEEAVTSLVAQGVFARQIRVTYASHCSHVETIRPALANVLAGVTPTTALIPMLSTVDAVFVDGETLDATYWYRNLRQRVRFAEALERVLGEGECAFVEISPHPVLTVAIKGILDGGQHRGGVVGTLRRESGGMQRVLLSLGELHCCGYRIDWNALFARHRPKRVELPTYPFQAQRHWIERREPHAVAQVRARQISPEGHPLLGSSFRMSTSVSTRYWERSLSLNDPAWLTDHRVEGTCLFPGTGFAELALAAARELSGSNELELRELELRRALLLPQDGSAVTVQVALIESDARSWEVSVAELQGEDWQLLASARVRVASESLREPPERGFASAQSRCRHALSADTIYAFATDNALNYGPAFRGIEAAWRDDDDGLVLGRIVLPEAAGSVEPFSVHPALLDACFQLTIAGSLGNAAQGPAVPIRVDRLQLDARIGRGPLWCAASAPQSVPSSDQIRTDLTLWNTEGELVGIVEGLRAAPLDRRATRDPLANVLLKISWGQTEVPRDVAFAGHWLILAGRATISERLSSLLRASVSAVEVVYVEPSDAARIHDTIQRALASGHLSGIFCLWSLEVAPLDDATPVSLDAVRGGWLGLLHAVQSLASGPRPSNPRLVATTLRARSVDGTATRPEQALVWGLGTTIRSEQPALRPLLVDLDRGDDAELATAVAFACSDTHEDQVVLRGDTCHVARVEPVPLPAHERTRSRPAAGDDYRLETSPSLTLDSLHLVAFEPGAPGPGEVEIAVAAAGINFRDVLLATGVVPPIGDASRIRLGFECAGTIARVGPDVRDLRVGQRVIAITADGFATRVLVEASHVFPLADSLSYSDAATLPIVQISAYYSLHHVARLRRGERVLIHSATGGVGLAALQWARHVGADIYATAGSEHKREWLIEQGIAHVSDSRSTKFANDIHRWTRGEGVDVILNALPGELMRASLALLRTGGRFVELGLRDALSNTQLGLSPFARGLTFSLVNVGEMVVHAMPRVREIFAEVLEHVERGVLGPLPFVASPLSKAGDAFWEMSRARHIGKFVVTIDETPPPIIDVPVGPADGLAREATYLITGGLGGLGVRLARWMAMQGAAHLVLLSRSGVASEQQRADVLDLESRGARVSVVAMDIADPDALDRVLAELPIDAPLRGVVHAAGLLDDAMLVNQSVERFEHVLRSKVAGAWNLHRATAQLDLDFFVLYSSAASVFGNAGQANYVAANAFLDALAHHRRSRGLPALSLGWGAFSEVGLAVGDLRGGRLESRGVITLTPDQGVELFARLVATSHTHVAPCPMDVARWYEFSPDVGEWPYFAELLEGVRSGRTDTGELADSLRAMPEPARHRLLLDLVTGELAKVLRVDPKKLGADSPFTDLGVDSLLGVELRNRIQAETKVNLPSTTIWTYPTPDKLAAHLAGLFAPTERPDESPPHEPQEDPNAALDDDEIAALLLAELDATDVP